MGDEAAESWKHYLKGLWWSGLRLSESLDVYWDARPDKLHVDLSGRRPMLRIPAGCEKGNRDRILPMAPEFAEFLLRTPEADRRGRVFKLKAPSGRGSWAMRSDTMSAIVCRIGKTALVVVDERVRRGKVRVKYASAQDLRRSFGERWSPRVMPQVLMELMRHDSIETTLKYYVGRNAERTADVLWAAVQPPKASVGNSFGNNGQTPVRSDQAEMPQPLIS